MKKSRNHNGNSKSKKGRGEQTTTLATVVNPRRELAFFKKEALGTPVRLRRRLTRPFVYSAVAANVFAVAEATGNVVNCTEWAALSPNYQQYRVRALRVRVVPRNRDNLGFAATVWFPGVVVSARYPSGSSSSSYAGVYAEGGSQVHTCFDREMVCMGTMDDNPDAALFTDCNAGAPPALSQYGVQFYGNLGAPAIYNGVTTHDCFADYDVEFISRN